jgi:hypothetical protein
LGQSLYRKPDILSFDRLRLVMGDTQAPGGTAVASAFAAGTAASALSAGIPADRLVPKRELHHSGLSFRPTMNH